MKNKRKPEIQELCRNALNVNLSNSASLKIQMALKEELDQIRNAPPKPVMTITEVADYLRVTPEIVEDRLGEIPCFEFGGKLLFRKEALDEWIQIREKYYSGEVIEFELKKTLKFSIA